MKYKITKAEIVGNNIQIEVYHGEDLKTRECFGLPLKFKDNYDEKIKEMFIERKKHQELKFKKSPIGKTFEV